jgi:hypothetical protein
MGLLLVGGASDHLHWCASYGVSWTVVSAASGHGGYIYTTLEVKACYTTEFPNAHAELPPAIS